MKIRISDQTITFNFGTTTVVFEAGTPTNKYNESAVEQVLDLALDMINTNKVQNEDIVRALQPCVYMIQYKDDLVCERINHAFVSYDSAECYLFDAGYVKDGIGYVGEDHSSCIIYKVPLK